MCVSVSSSEPEEVAVWKEASSSCLVSFFVCAVNTLKMFPLVLLLIQLECLSCYFHIKSFILKAVVVLSNP